MKKQYLLLIAVFSVTSLFAQSDNPCGTPSLTVSANSSGSWTTGSNVGATNSYVTLEYADGPENGDVWYVFTVPSSGSVVIETDYASSSLVNDLGMSVYTANTCQSLISSFARNDHYLGNSVYPPNWMPRLSLNNLIPSTTIYLRLWQYNVVNNSRYGTFLVRAYDNGNPPPSTASISLSPASLNFGNVQTGTSSMQNLLITNSGSSTLNISNIAASGGYTIQTSLIVAAGSSQTIPVTFHPTSATTYSGQISFVSNATQGTISLPVSGTGTTAAQSTINVTPTQIDFGSISISAGATTEDFTISNSGNAPLTISSITVPTGYSVNWTSGTIAALTQKNIRLSFNPSSAISYNGNLTIASNATNTAGGTATISLLGTGLALQPTLIAGYVKDLYINATNTQLLEGYLSGATVNLKSSTNQILATRTTNNTGQFSFSGFSGSNYTIEVISGGYTVTKSNYSPNGVSLKFVLPVSLAYEILLQTTELENERIQLNKGSAYSINGPSFITSGYQNALSASNTYNTAQYNQVKESLGRLFATQQLLIGYYRNSAVLADKGGTCVYDLTSLVFSYIVSIDNILKTFHIAPTSVLGKLAGRYKKSKYEFMKDGMSAIVAGFPNGPVAQSFADLQALIDQQFLSIDNQPTVFDYAVDPIELVYQGSAQLFVKYPFRNPSQTLLNSAYNNSSNLNSTYTSSLSNIISDSKLSPLVDANSMNNNEVAVMNGVIIYSDAASSVSSAFTFASTTAALTGFLSFAAPPLRIIAYAIDATNGAALLGCIGEGIHGENNRAHNFANIASSYAFKTDSISPLVNSDLTQMVTDFNNYANEVKDNFDYSQDQIGINKLDSLDKLSVQMTKAFNENLSYIIAASRQQDSITPGFYTNYVNQLVVPVFNARMKLIATQMLYLAKIADSTDASVDVAVVTITQNLINANNNALVALTQYQNLVQPISTNPYNVITNVAFNERMLHNTTQTASVTVKNFGNQTAQDVFLKVSFQDGFTCSTDSIYIGILQSNHSVTLSFDISAPSFDTIGKFTLATFSSNSTTHNYGSAIISAATLKNSVSSIVKTTNILQVYPNPATTSITIHSSAQLNQEVQIDIEDVTGRNLLSNKYDLTNSNDANINIGNLAAGTYICIVSNNTFKQIFKIIKQ